MLDLKDLVRDSALQLVPLLVRRRQARPSPVRNLLVIRPDHLGDILFTFPALHSLRLCFPDARIAFLVGPWAQPLLERNKDIDQVITCDFPWFNRRAKKSVLEPYSVMRELAGRLQSYSFDAAINLRFDFWWGAMTAYLAGIPTRAGYDLASCRPFLTHGFGYSGGRHEVEQNVNLVSQFVGSLGDTGRLRADKIKIDFATTEQDERFAAAYLRGRGIGESDVLVALHPGSGSPAKQWDARNFSLVGNELARTHKCAIIITGGNEEKELASEIAKRITGRCIIAAGDTSIGQLAAVLRRCTLAIGVDSGPMHLAVAVGTPSVHLFGPSDHRVFGPFGDEEEHKIVRAGFPCSPCGRFDFLVPKRQSDCMSAITVEQVLGEAIRLLRSRATR